MEFFQSELFQFSKVPANFPGSSRQKAVLSHFLVGFSDQISNRIDKRARKRAYDEATERHPGSRAQRRKFLRGRPARKYKYMYANVEIHAASTITYSGRGVRPERAAQE